MKKKIEDYMHLYLGCEVESNFNRRRKLVGFLYNESGNTKAMILDFNEDYSRIGQPYSVDFLNCKPLLRPLNSITNDDAHAIADELEIITSSVYRWVDAGLSGNITTFSTQVKFINALRKRYYDCDGLIESCLAIDKRTLK